MDEKSNKSPGKARRRRRTKEEVEKVFYETAKKIVEEVGFSNLTVSKIIQEAKIEPAVFYNRYKDMDDFLDKFVRAFDYWLKDSITLNPKLELIENYQSLLSHLIDAFAENELMQKLIAWEMTEDNYITRRTAQNRDANSQHLITFFSDELSGCEVDFAVATAILIGGLYYLVIHRKMATFNNVNFNSPEGIQLLKDNMIKMVARIFSDYRNPNETDTPDPVVEERIRIAKNLKKHSVDNSIIQKACGLKKREVEKL